MSLPFNTPLEIGIRILVILGTVFPRQFDLQHLVYFDYFAVHSGDVNGPKSLHANLPYRSGELTIRRELLERGLLLMMSRGLVAHYTTERGFMYSATENTAAFVSMMSSEYILELQERVHWVMAEFSEFSIDQLKEIERQLFQDHSIQFHQSERVREVNS